MRRAILMGLVWALGAGAATAQETETVASRRCGGSLKEVDDRVFLGLEVVGLTGGAEQRLVCFSELLPALSRTIGVVGSGLSVDTRLVGIDYRPATGELYGLGDAGGVYTLDPSTADAALQSRLNVALSGTSFGVDFNPAVDRLRVISDSGQNLRVDVTTGATTVDAGLTRPPTAGPALGVTSAAYTNNDADAATATTLFVIQTADNSMLIQAPPNNGTLNFTGTLRQDVLSESGFDIFSRVSSLGITSDNLGFAALGTAGRSRFYHVNLFTGEATLRGTFAFDTPVVDIAIPTRQ
jgi:hypothetical protein